MNVATPMAKFEVREVLKGADALGGAKLIEAPFFDEKPLGGDYLILGTQQGGHRLGSPLRPHAAKPQVCLRDRQAAGCSGPERLAYFQNYFEDSEDLLKNDSYYEFALAPYTMLQAMKDECSTTSWSLGCRTRWSRSAIAGFI